jgi:hypothetical protein
MPLEKPPFSTSSSSVKSSPLSPQSVRQPFVDLPFKGNPSRSIRFQCRDRRIQEYFLHRLGCWRAGQDPPALEALQVPHLVFLPLFSEFFFQTSRTLRVSFSSLIQTIGSVSQRHGKSCKGCSMRMSSAMRSSLSSPISKIYPMP